MNHIKPYGTIILNADDEFYIYHKKIAHKKKLNILYFEIKNKFSFVKLVSAKKINMNKYLLSIKIGKSLYSFYSKNNNKSNLFNILATITLIYKYKIISKLNKSVFYNFKNPSGRGDISIIKIKSKKIFLLMKAIIQILFL